MECAPWQLAMLRRNGSGPDAIGGPISYFRGSAGWTSPSDFLTRKFLKFEPYLYDLGDLPYVSCRGSWALLKYVSIGLTYCY